MVHQSDLTTNNVKMNEKIKLAKPEPHYIVDIDLIALLEYLCNTMYNPGDTLLNHPEWHKASRDKTPPHFKHASYSPGTTGNWTQGKTKQFITNYPELSSQVLSLEQIYPGGRALYIKGGQKALTSTSFRCAYSPSFRPLTHIYCFHFQQSACPAHAQVRCPRVRPSPTRRRLGLCLVRPSPLQKPPYTTRRTGRSPSRDVLSGGEAQASVEQNAASFRMLHFSSTPDAIGGDHETKLM
jgi:hypothetical protein